MSSTRQKRLEKAQIRVLFSVPFFAAGVAKLPVVWDETVETACTDGKEVRWSPKFFDSLSDQELVTVLCHEVCHCMLGHLWRAPGGVDWQQWNIATDHAVNLMLKDFSKVVMGQNKADPFPFPDPQDAYCADPAYAGLAEEVIYSKLMARPKQPGGGNGGQTAPGGASQPGGSSGKGQPKKTPQNGNSGSNPAPEPGSMPSFGQMSQPKPGQSPSNKKLRNDWDGVLINSVKTAQGRGELPAGMERLVDALLKPAVPWWELLRVWIREQVQDDWNWHRPDPLFDESGFIMPSLDSERMGSVVFAVDTSGSIDARLLAQFKTEIQAVLDELNPSKVLEICCDAKIQLEREYLPGEMVGKEAPGGGGTSFTPVMTRCQAMHPQPKCIVYLTDGEGDYGEDPGLNVLWVMYGGRDKAPYGEVVKVV